MWLVFIVFKKSKKKTKINNHINIINNCVMLCVLYKFIHLINKPGRKKNIMLIELTEYLYKLIINNLKLYYNTF